MKRGITRIGRGALGATLALLMLATPASAQVSDPCAQTASVGWAARMTFIGPVGGTGEVVSITLPYATGDLLVATSRMVSGPDVTYTFYFDHVAIGAPAVPHGLSVVVPADGFHSVGIGSPSPFVGEIEVTVACYSAEGLEAMIDQCVSDQGIATALHNHAEDGNLAFLRIVDAQAGRKISEECAERLAAAAEHLFGAGSG